MGWLVSTCCVRVAGAGKGEVPLSTKIILSHHDYDETPGDDVLDALVNSPHIEASGCSDCKALAFCCAQDAQMKSSMPVGISYKCACLSWPIFL